MPSTLGLVTMIGAMVCSAYLVLHTNLLTQLDKVMYTQQHTIPQQSLNLPSSHSITPLQPNSHARALDTTTVDVVMPNAEQPHTSGITYTRMCPIKHSTRDASDYINNRLWLPQAHQWVLVSDTEVHHHAPHVGAGHFVDVVMWTIHDGLVPLAEGSPEPKDVLSKHLTAYIQASPESEPTVTQCTLHLENVYSRVMQHSPHILRCALSTRVTQPYSVRLQLRDTAYEGVEQALNRTALTEQEQRDKIGSHTNWPIDASVRQLDIQLCQYTTDRQKYGVCAAPITSPVSAQSITQWIDYHLFLGVDTAFVYVRNATEYVDILQPYIQAGRVEMVYWPLPDSPQDSVTIYIDQSISLRHCYVTARYNTDWLLYIDVDEYLVPFQQSVIAPTCTSDVNGNVQCDSVLERQMAALELGDAQLQSFSADSNVAALSIPAVEYIIKQDNPDSSWLVHQYPLRKPKITWARTKFMSRPQWNIEGWIHSVNSMPGYRHIAGMQGHRNEDILTIEGQDKIEPKFAFRLHHYASLIVNRDDGFLAGKEMSVAADISTLIRDDAWMKQMTQAIDHHKQSSVWPAEREV